ncbi:NYN domain-containing protein [Emcibacter sp. SYSU 3D8]|uniref:NYN domain-containing protein n=1 Tax=Emcibacter sp. SYSU 3D8 TaxID=3133969 RepID=UPI0031FEF45C
MAENQTQRLSLAVLIDAENASPKIANGLFEEIARIGDANVRRIYGDFSHPGTSGWREILSKHAISPRQNFPSTKGKNSSDIELVIDAMDLLHSGRVDGFCLVSSDSDFTGLAKRIREQGQQVIGFGEQKTPESLRQACHRFIYTENLGATAETTGGTDAPSPTPMQSQKASALLRNVVSQIESEDGWVHLGQLGNVLRSIHPDFDERSYGFRKLSDLLKSTGQFDIEQPDGGGWRVRIKPAGKTRRKAK